MLNDLELLQKKPETRHHKTESHQGQTGANPCQKSALSSQVVTEAGALPDFC